MCAQHKPIRNKRDHGIEEVALLLRRCVNLVNLQVRISQVHRAFTRASSDNEVECCPARKTRADLHVVGDWQE